MKKGASTIYAIFIVPSWDVSVFIVIFNNYPDDTKPLFMSIRVLLSIECKTTSNFIRVTSDYKFG